MERLVPWDRDWIEFGESRGGGRGKVRTVRRRGDKSGAVYALKTPHYEKRDRERFIREAKILGRILNFEGVPRLIDAGFGRGKALYMVMEYIEGPTLEQHITSQGPMSLDLALRLSDRLLASIEGLHRHGIGHRDLKPDNIILRKGDVESPVIVDLGKRSTVMNR